MCGAFIALDCVFAVRIRGTDPSTSPRVSLWILRKEKGAQSLSHFTCRTDHYATQILINGMKIRSKPFCLLVPFLPRLEISTLHRKRTEQGAGSEVFWCQIMCIAPHRLGLGKPSKISHRPAARRT